MGYVYQTKEGLPIKFKVYEQDPQDLKMTEKGWVVHRIEAYVGGMAVGYLKISYIPQAKFDELYKTLWHYLKNYKDYPIKDPTDPDSVYRGIVTKRSGYRWNHDPDLAEVPEKKVRDKHLRMLLKESPEAKDYLMFSTYLVDHPFVDYIQVEFKGEGIGTALYKYGARWLAKTKGLPLYASSLQSEDAQQAWRSMRKPGKRIPIFEEPHPTDPSKIRTRIDYRGLAASLALNYFGRSLIRTAD